MANNKSSKKRVLISEKNRKNNISNRSMIRTFIKKVYFFIKNNKKDEAVKAFTKMQSILDRQVQKGIIHKNKASRHKSNLTLQIRKIK